MRIFQQLILMLVIGFLSLPVFAQGTDVWPRTYDDAQGDHVMLYQPQFEQWDNYTTLDSIVVAAVLPAGEKSAALGTIKLTATTEVDKAAGQVHFTNIKITEVNFPTLDSQSIPKYTQVVQNILPKNDVVLSLARVSANLQRNQGKISTVNVKNDAPPIYFSQTPAVLVNLNGDPIWTPILATQLLYAINTNWDLFKDQSNNTYYLLDGQSWLKTSDLKDPWQAAGSLPPDFNNLPNNGNWKNAKANLPGKPIAANQLPTVFVSTTPAELIVTVISP